MELFLPLAAGYLLDLIFGDPRSLPHPVVLFGKAIAFFEKHLNRGRYRFAKGAFTGLFLAAAAFALSAFLLYAARQCGPYAYYPAASVIVFFCLANRSLTEEGREVIETLEKKGIEAGRKRLSWIVGRETDKLSANGIYTAVLETMAENLSDGVTAPLFWYAAGAAAGYFTGGVAAGAVCAGAAMMLYKMVNTLDSMIGYRDKRYREFGCFSARMDDVFNYIPARLTAFAMSLLFFRRGQFAFVRRYCRSHASPNSGFPEAAMAGILRCRFGGTHIYHGEPVAKPYIGTDEREMTSADLKKAVIVNHTVTFFFVFLYGVFLIFIVR